jgi:hypothetical protein
MWTESEMLHSLSGVLGTPQQNGIGASRGSQSELVQRQCLAARLFDSRSSGSREAERSNRKFGNLEQAVIIRDCSNNDNGLSLGSFLGAVGNESGERYGRTVDSGHEKSAENDLVEIRIGPAFRSASPSVAVLCTDTHAYIHTSKEAVQLHEELQVDVLALGSRSMAVADMMAVQIDT